MTAHPLLLGIAVLDSLATLLLVVASLTSLRILLRWQAQSSTRLQLRLERAQQAASLATRSAWLLVFISSLLLVYAISNVLPGLIEGAMCGTGVLQAMQGLGERALALRALALLALFGWSLCDRCNRSLPDAALSERCSRLLLLALPLFIVAFWTSMQALWALDVHEPVSCCSVVYDQFDSVQQAQSSAAIADRFWVAATFIGVALLLILALLQLKAGVRKHVTAIVLVAVAVCWLPIAYVALVRVLAAYHYGVLQHHCPWCLFLPEHYLLGFPFLLAFTLVLAEALAAPLLLSFASADSRLETFAGKRLRYGMLRVIAGLLLFAALGGLPPLVWRLMHGVWMSGN